MYSFAELLGWMEVIRRSQEFLDVGEEQATKGLNECIALVGRTLSTDSISDGAGNPCGFMIWRQEQRAIGEVMIAVSEGRERCIGYASFVDRLDDQRFARWFERLRADVEIAIDNRAAVRPRLAALAVSLRKLLDQLDENGVRSVRRD